MADNTIAASYQGSGQAPGATPLETPAGQPQGQEAQQGYITKQEALRIADEASEKAFRRAQGLVTKLDVRVKERFQAQLDALKKAEVPVTNQQAEALRQQITDAVIAEESGPTLPTNLPLAQVGDGQGSIVDPINAQVEAYESKYGVKMEVGDPELALIKRYPAPIEEYFQTYQEALKAKTKRITQQVNPPVHTPTSLGGSGTPVPDTVTSLTAQLAKLMEHPSDNMKEISRLRGELEKAIK